MSATGLSYSSPLLTSQSSAFFMTPGTPCAYSGLEIRTPSLASSWDRKSRTAGGGFSVSRSGLKCGSSDKPKYTTTWTSSGARALAACNSAVFEELPRRLPDNGQYSCQNFTFESDDRGQS